MDEFKRQIVKKYESEVNPKPTGQDWSSFMKYKHEVEKKPERKIFWLVFLGLGLLLFSQIMWRTWDTPILPMKQFRPVKQIDKNSNILESDVENEDKEKVEVEQNISKLSNVKDRASKIMGPTLAGAVTREGVRSASYTASTYPTVKTILDSNFAMPVTTSAVEEMTSFRSIGHVEPVEATPNSLLRLAEPSIESKISPTSIHAIREGRLMTELYVGMAFPSNDLLLDEQAYQFGGKLYYYMRSGLRSKLNLQFSSVNFVTKTMEPSIGVDPIESPSEFVEFSRAIVESFNFQTEIGMDWFPLRKKRWNPYLGIGFSAVKEVLRDVDYEFMGKEVDNPPRNVSISARNTQNRISKLLILDAGCLLETKYGGFSLSISLPYQLENNQRDVLNHVKLNIGLSRRF